MNEYNCNSLKNLPVPGALIEKALAIPAAAEKAPVVLPWYRRTKMIAAAASIVLVTVLGITVYFLFGNINPPIKQISTPQTATIPPTDAIENTDDTVSPTGAAVSERADDSGVLSPTSSLTRPTVPSSTLPTNVPAVSADPERPTGSRETEPTDNAPTESSATSPAPTERATASPEPVQPATEQPVTQPATSPPATEKPTDIEPTEPTALPEPWEFDPTEEWFDPSETPSLVILTATIPEKIRSQQLPVYCRILRSNGTLVGDKNWYSDQHRASAYLSPGYDKAVYDPIGNGLNLTAGDYTYYFYDSSGKTFAAGSFHLDE